MIFYHILGTYFLFYSIYTSFHLLNGSKRVSREKKGKNIDISYQEWVVFLPAYKPGKVFLEVLEAIQNAAFPGKLHIYVLLQEASEEIASKIKAYDGVYVEEKSFKEVIGNPYHEVLRYMCRQTKDRISKGELQPTHVVLLDKDNIVASDFFEVMASNIQDYDIVQGRRAPLKVETAGQAYDALAEALNDAMFRMSRMKIGASPEFSGSGLVFDFASFDYATTHLDPKAPGMDKNLLIQLLLRDQPPLIGYIPEAVIYEEKTEKLEALQSQRVRWFGNQYYNALYYWKKLFSKGKLDTIDYAIALFRPPRSVHWLLLLLGTGLELICWMFFGSFFPLFSVSLLATGLGITKFVLSEKKRGKWFRQIMKKVPSIALNNLLSVWKGIQKKSQGKFIHTEH
ncbi:glycosyltransferase [Algivirga pacifica]|uniref:Glycosyltransferase family 2 protein n=1 Tax=Algivirga pacifica TaxID=1162670 RepID=A0ABP9DJF2_9BACT